ncbi:putative RNA recognition motif domain, nucleotide-binding alpha-beta plait domain superfamily [Helianthus annuus]|nr:putative RNA recognition motif domain, nucleotide-binding alpha-beta plait domain superfamily [Helianthus annuus]
MGGPYKDVTKFFVTNLPEGCTPWELRKGLEGYGAISASFVAKKRNKTGSRFGFMSFVNVLDKVELEKSLKGAKLGNVSLKINIAMFAVENTGNSVQQEVSEGFNVDSVDSGSSGSGKSVVEPDRTLAFNDVIGFAVVGRTVDLEMLVDLDRMLKITKISYLRIQFLGGLSILISFSEEESASKFLDSRGIWGPWFSKLEAWKGQSLPLERVVWLKLHGIPLHLLDVEVLMQVGELFGKVLHSPKSVSEDLDLSLVTVGVLAGEAARIREFVTLSWKGRSFRVWVEEEQEAWVPDCMGRCLGVSPASSSGSPLMSSPVGNMEVEGTCRFGSSRGEEEVHALDVDPPVVDLGNMQEEREKGGDGESKDDMGSPRNLCNFQNGSPLVGSCPVSEEGGPSISYFILGQGDKKMKAHVRAKRGVRSRKDRSMSVNNSSPVEGRPKKRSRPAVVDYEPGFGFIGFTSNGKPENASSVEGFEGGIDLNARAAPELSGDVREVAHRDCVTGIDQGSSGGVEGTHLEKELHSTLAIGEQLGVELRFHLDLVKKAVLSTGINGVSS